MSLSYIQYGCGLSAPDGWRNYDASLTLRFERLPLIGRLYTRNATRFPKNVLIGDIVAGLPEKPERAAGVYCSHVLEHLSLEDCRTALRNTYLLLKPEGIFRLVLPDMEIEARKYLDNPAPDAISQFMRSTSLGMTHRRGSLKDAIINIAGRSRHLWMWDYTGLAQELMAAGFTDIRRAFVGDSPDPAFAAVEDPDRWLNCLGIECRRPSS